ncbi:MAG: hypothetical protein JW861_13265 [Bacteroidales bacterium]|nr:hypothetical protein [Bacteroidales bacterium]
MSKERNEETHNMYAVRAPINTILHTPGDPGGFLAHFAFPVFNFGSTAYKYPVNVLVDDLKQAFR